METIVKTKNESKAKKAVEKGQWEDVLVRTSFDDTGKIPTSGTASHSPDIVPNGANLLDKPVEHLTSDANWKKDIGTNVLQARQNFIYMRGINLHDGPRKGRFYCYYSPANILLYPSDWKHNQMRTSSGEAYIEFDAKKKNERVATNQPFTWIPGPVDGHYCLIGRVYTEEHPNEIPETGGITSFTKWILENPNNVWRNVSMISSDLPTYTKVVPYAQGNESHEMDLGISWENLPVGSYIAFSCGTPLPNGQKLELPKTKVTTKSGRLTIPAGEIPANWVTKVAYSYWDNGQTPPPGFKINFEGFYTAPSTDELYEHAFPMEYFGITSRQDKLGKPIKLIPVGGDSFMGVDPVKLEQGNVELESMTDFGTNKVEANVFVNDVKWKSESRSFLGRVTYADTDVSIEKVTGKDKFVYDQVSINHAGSTAKKPSYEMNIDYKQNDVAGLLDFSLRCNEIPVGYSVALNCDETGPNPPIQIGKTEVTRPDMAITVTSKVPANFSGKLVLSVWQNDEETSADSKVTLQVLQPAKKEQLKPLGISIGSSDTTETEGLQKVAQVVALLN